MTAPVVPGLGPQETRLLLDCGRLEQSDERRAETERLMREPLAWDPILFHARLHSVAPLLYRHLSRIDRWDLLPDRVRSDLLRLYHRTAYQNRIFTGENRRLLDAFDAAGVPVLIQKGLPLVERVYGSLALRPLIDLVFLVPEGSTRTARDVLTGAGYRRQPVPPVEAAYRWCCPQLWCVADREMRIAVLLQSDLVNWPRLHRFDPASLWWRASPAVVGGRRVHMLCPIDQVLYLCLQADNHGHFNRVAVDATDPVGLVLTEWTNNRLIRFTDLHAVIRHHAGDIDWRALIERARTGAIEDAVYTSLSLTNALLGPVVEPMVLDRLRVDRPRRLRGWIFRAIAPDVAVAGPRSMPAVRSAYAQPMSHTVVRRLWFGVSRRLQGHLGRLVGLAEYCVPSPSRFRRCVGIRSRSALALHYVTHVLYAVGRSTTAYLVRRIGLSVERAARRAARLVRRLQTHPDTMARTDRARG